MLAAFLYPDDLRRAWREPVNFARPVSSGGIVPRSRTKTAGTAPVNYTDKNGLFWKITPVGGGSFIGESVSYSPKAQDQFGSSLGDTQDKIEKWAYNNKPGKLFTDFGGARVDANGAFWTRVDQWAPFLSVGSIVPLGTAHYSATSPGYNVPAYVTAETELLLVDALDAFAASHAANRTVLMPAPVPGPVPGPLPKTPSAPAPTPGPAPGPSPTPAPAPVPSLPPSGGSGGGDLLTAGVVGAGLFALWKVLG